MTDAERLEEVRAWASVTRPEDDDGPTFFLLNRGDRLEAEVERLQSACTAWERDCYHWKGETEKFRALATWHSSRGIDLLAEVARLRGVVAKLEGFIEASAGRATSVGGAGVYPCPKDGTVLALLQGGAWCPVCHTVWRQTDEVALAELEGKG